MSDEGHRPGDPVIAAIAARVAADAESLAERFAEAYTADIGDYARVPVEGRHELVRSARANLDALLEDLQGTATSFDPEPFESFGADRVRMGITIGAVMRSFTVWGQQAWSAFLQRVDHKSGEEMAGSLAIGERIFAHVERASAATAAGFMREAMAVWSDREITRNAVLEAMLTGHADPEELRRTGMEVGAAYAVVVLLPRDRSVRPEELVAPAVALTERHHSGSRVLVGVREAALVAIWLTDGPTASIQLLTERLAAALEATAGIAVAGESLAGVPAAYQQARRTARIALGLGCPDPLWHNDVLLERVVLDSPAVAELCHDALSPLITYDDRRDADLVPTITAFIDSCGSVTETARAVSVHPNTVIYRLRRVASISGYDPRDPRGLLALSLASLARRLGAEPAAPSRSDA
ncbi:PucR family transcriptional regulator [Sciscionella marina]|uniref:PucR family transcriptional regulator n=1 Tax=Sciscionella marina TaxID=508770 RepID=UPI0003756BD5|nr:helix-turn-helix domain-containing protein [Sciscionella marina]